MFMRFVQLKVKPESAEAFERFYEFRLAPAVRAEPGCIFARLIQSDSTPTEFLSFTIWKTHSDAETYESSGRFDDLIKENEPFLEDTAEWKIQLSDDNTLEYKPVKEKPTIQAMPIAAGTDESDLTKEIGSDVYIRILSARLKTGRFKEFQKAYDELITPTVESLDGCRGIYLIGQEGSEEILSITIWDKKADAEYYEASGTFDGLVEQVKPYLSALYQWKMSLDSEKQTTTQTSDDLSIEGYHIVTGEKLDESTD